MRGKKEIQGKTLHRIVYRDLGAELGKEGRPVHKIEFAYACDQKVPGKDAPVPNPYLKSYRVKAADGKIRISHADYLTEPVYQRLKKYSSDAGMDSCGWDGMILAGVNSFRTEKGKDMVYVDLSRQAEEEWHLAVPEEAFQQLSHDSFVRQSLAEVNRRRVAEAADRLPEMTKPDSELSLEC